MGIIEKMTSKARPAPYGSSVDAAIATVCLLLLMFSPLKALAVDGRIEVRGNLQDGGAGSTAYETSTIWENYSLAQRIDLGKNILMQMDFITRRQTLESRSPLIQTDSEILSYLPTASLSFRAGEFRLGLNASASRKDFSGNTIASRRDEHTGFSGWLRQKWNGIEFDLNALESSSQREADQNIIDNREHSHSGTVRFRPTQNDELRYNYSRNVQDQRSYNTSSTFINHSLQYRSSHGFAGDRGRISMDARTDYLKQTNTFSSDVGSGYLAPNWGGYNLDDTPEELDPLEADPIFASALFDKDRDASTGINIGDSASVVRLYGGDYRNFSFDFGDTEPMDEIMLYVDTILRFPELMQWRVFTSDDPEGRDWSNELTASQFTAKWEELANGRQGWRFTFDPTIEHRRIKVVNFKLGLTEPDILVTEMEVYQIVDAGSNNVVQTVRRQRLQGDVSYRLASHLNLQYSTNLSDRRYGDSERIVTGSSHRFGANWQLGPARLSASHETDRIRNTTGQNTDANSQRVSLTNRFSGKFTARVAWAQTEDKSWTLRHKTQSTSADFTLQAAPNLRINQKVSYGIRDASSLGIDSQSWTSRTTIRGRPRPTMEIELRRSDRWVSHEAGADFSTFNNTELQTTWAVFPLLSFSSQIIYQVRDTDDLLVRNALVWNPVQGGSVSLRLHANDYQDTRSEWFQRGAGSTVTWRPRPRLYLEGGIEWALVKQYDERNTPTNVQFRGSWSF